ncbi:hypothetical protein AJ80_02453 [Polytolypa hystricis UAMH7299]|uniref:NADPH:adrenodoxin oxidoreductase, mitochondrial n=1 Tax=Polytolypa hystricis (strain UAMH7299) TaxID=1447883 RepID=A0A2B7YR46_POLH7|nr:hypothetical protein AJ80_02453 [Polytolypa hystricis UAMH7299]
MNLPRTPNICTQCLSHISRSLKSQRTTTLSSISRAPPRRFYSSSSNVANQSRPFRVAVVGSGPAGFYAAYRLMQKVENAFVDMYEQLPVPFGLVRYGVAPDHPEVKNCQDKFTEVAQSPRFNFIGNIELGTQLPLTALKPHYDAILFSYGASEDKELKIPGERDIRGVYSARAFVGWYNGLPEHRDLEPDLEAGEEAVVIGQGNVALDVARVLLTDVDVLRKTDMADYAVEALAKSKIKRVRVIGRRGPMQAAFTIKEIRELLQLPGVSFDPIPVNLFPPEGVIKTLPRAQKRLTQLLIKGSATNASAATKSWSLDFLLSPHSFHSNPHQNNLSHLKCTLNQLDPNDPFSPSSKVGPLLQESDGQVAQLDITTNLCFRSIGYQSLPLPGLHDLDVHFNAERGIIPNDGQGRVLPLAAQETGNPSLEMRQSHVPGLYCAGWVKRGPTGVIASTMTDAFATADAIAADWMSHTHAAVKIPFLNFEQQGGRSTGLGWEGVRGEAGRLGLRATSWRDWKRIDEVEKEKGEAKGKVREKIGDVEEMLRVLD